MDYSFPNYLLSKQSVDDRALNKDVLAALKASLPESPLRITEVGGGIGTMLARLLRWGLISRAEYTLVDETDENIGFARVWLREWARKNGLDVKADCPDEIELFDGQRYVCVKLVHADVFDFVEQLPEPADLLIAHAFLDLLPLPEGLYKLFALTRDLAWLTLNFDGVSSLEPVVDADLDARIERLYHATMDARPGGGDSLSGRHLFGYLEQAGAEIVSAGASDWVAYPVHGRYPADEAYFLEFILHFFEESLENHPELDPAAFAGWLAKRRQQAERGELVYIAHQMDFLCKIPSPMRGEGKGEG
jgi:hypothetical protein